jgi:hypothetical protein
MFEFHNPHPRKICITLPNRAGAILVESGAYLPTAEQEAQGFKADFFKDYIVPNLLHPTPESVRRSLLQKAVPVAAAVSSTPVAVDPVVVPTEPEVLGKTVAPVAVDPTPAAPAAIPPVPAVPEATVAQKHASKPIKEEGLYRGQGIQNLAESLQSLADASCSSKRSKKVDNP